MNEQIKQIFTDATATEADLEHIDRSVLQVVHAVRALVDSTARAHPNVLLELPLRVYLCRVIHADMEMAFMPYRTISNDV